jgi:Ca-activated chloride channel family protein
MNIDLLAETDYHPLPEEDRCPGVLRTERGHLPLKRLDVRARITGLVAETEVSQTFVNTLGVPLEATYIFPLPSRAAVTGFRFEAGGRVIEADLQERGAARRNYAAAIQTGHRAAIAEEERPGVFTMRVGNLMPGEAATVHLTLAGPLTLDGCEATYRFPLVVAPRYMPGVPLAGGDVGDGVARDTDQVPDASRISPPVLIAGYPNPVQLGIEVDLDPAGLHMSSLKSTLHAATAESGPGGSTRVRVQPGERLNRDFVLRFGVATESLTTSLATFDDDDGRGGTFALTLVPPAARQAAAGRDVVFVLDRSGSMGGWKMVAARRAVARMVDGLNTNDRFSVLAFDNMVESPHRGLVDATDRARFAAVEWLSKVDARGGTEMYQPLNEAASYFDGYRGAREPVIVLITDGQVGNEAQLVKLVGDKARSARVFTLGIDRAVNEGFLRRLAEMSGGTCSLVENEERLDEVMDDLHRKLGVPVLVDLRVTGPGVDEGSMVPARLPDLLEGVPVRIFGRYAGPAPRELTVMGRGTSRLRRRYEEPVPAYSSRNAAVGASWARGRVRDLEDRYDRGERGVQSQIVETSLRYSVLCRFTAFVAVDRAEIVNAGGHNHQVTQAVEQPEGWDMARTRAGGGGRRRPQASSPPTGEFRREALMEVEEELCDDFDGEAISGLSAAMSADEAPVQAAFAPPPAPAAAAPSGPPPPRNRRALRMKSEAMPASVARAAPKKKSRSLLSRGAELLKSLGAAKPASPRGLDFARDLRRELLDADEHQWRAVLTAMVPKVDLWLGELSAAGVSARDMTPVYELKAALDELVSGRETVDEVYLKVLDLLTRISGGQTAQPPVAPQAPGRREDFWR